MNRNRKWRIKQVTNLPFILLKDIQGKKIKENTSSWTPHISVSFSSTRDLVCSSALSYTEGARFMKLGFTCQLSSCFFPKQGGQGGEDERRRRRQEERRTRRTGLPSDWGMNWDLPFHLSHPSISQKLSYAAGADVYLLGGGEMPGKWGLPPPKSSGQWKTLPRGLAPSAAHRALAG